VSRDREEKKDEEEEEENERERENNVVYKLLLKQFTGFQNQTFS